MEIGERQKLELLGQNLKWWSEEYSKEKKRLAKSEYDLSLIVASKIAEIKEFKGNWSFESALIYLLSLGDEGIKEMFKDYKFSEATVKSAEKIMEAIKEEINIVKFMNREVI